MTTSIKPKLFIEKPIISTKEAMSLKPNQNNIIRNTPELIQLLLKDRTTRRNIIWASDSYSKMGLQYQPNKPIKINLITNGAGNLIKPRSQKAKNEQIERTKGRAEVFTPTYTSIPIYVKEKNIFNEQPAGLKVKFSGK